MEELVWINDLKPCPFCGGAGVIKCGIDGKLYISAEHKKKCLIQSDTWLMSTKSLKKQLKAWNLRPEEV